MYVVDHPPQVLRLEAVIKFLLEARLERGERRRHRLPRQPADRLQRLKVHPKEALDLRVLHLETTTRRVCPRSRAKCT